MRVRNEKICNIRIDEFLRYCIDARVFTVFFSNSRFLSLVLSPLLLFSFRRYTQVCGDGVGGGGEIRSLVKRTRRRRYDWQSRCLFSSADSISYYAPSAAQYVYRAQAAAGIG